MICEWIGQTKLETNQYDYNSISVNISMYLL
jgi:hypothetical protein